MSGGGKEFTTETNASRRIALINELVTGPPADAMLEISGIFNSTTPIQLLDNATGVGNLIFRFLSHKEELDHKLNVERIVAADIDQDYLTWLQERVDETRSSVQVLHHDQQSDGLESNCFTHIYNNFGVFFAASDATVLQQTLRMLRPGGIALFSSWKAISWWEEVVEPGLQANLPEAPALPKPLDLFRKLGWTDSNRTEAKLRDAGFVNVQSQVRTFTPDVEPVEFAAAIAHLVKATAAKAWSQEVNERFGPHIEQALMNYLHSNWSRGRWTGTVTALLTFGWKEGTRDGENVLGGR